MRTPTTEVTVLLYYKVLSEERPELLKNGEALLKSKEVTDPTYRTRISAVLSVLNNNSVKNIAISFGKSLKTIYRWIYKVLTQGWSSLQSKKSPGRPRKLNNLELEQIKTDVSKDPSDFNLRIWDGPSLRHYIETKFKKKISLRSCYRIFHLLGFSLIRPQIFPNKGKANQPQRENFKKNLYNISKCLDKILVFQDEVHFNIQTTVTRMWGKKGQKHRVASPSKKQSVKYSGFVVPSTGELIMTEPEWFTFEHIIESVRELLKKRPIEPNKKYVIVLDNAPWHKKALRLIAENKDGEYQDILDAVEFVSLPTYSPDLNPIEQVWRIVRRKVTHNRYYATLEDLVTALTEYFSEYREPNEEFKKLTNFKNLIAPAESVA